MEYNWCHICLCAKIDICTNINEISHFFLSFPINSHMSWNEIQFSNSMHFFYIDLIISFSRISGFNVCGKLVKIHPYNYGLDSSVTRCLLKTQPLRFFKFVSNMPFPLSYASLSLFCIFSLHTLNDPLGDVIVGPT